MQSLSKLMSSETSDIQLNHLANRLCLRLEPIVFKDELRLLKTPTEKRNYNYIINLRDPAHWVALHKPKNRNEMYYFNTFTNEFGGIPTDIIDFVKRCKAILYESDKPIQDPRRGYCGQYCVLWLSYMNRVTNDLQDFNDYLNLFKDTKDDIINYKEKYPDLPY